MAALNERARLAAPVDRVGGEPDMAEQTVPNATTTRERLANLIAQFERGHHTADEMPDLILRTMVRDRVGGEGLRADFVRGVVASALRNEGVGYDRETRILNELDAALVNDETADTASPVELVEPGYDHEVVEDAWGVSCCEAHAAEAELPRPAPAPSEDVVTALRLPWHRETVGHSSIEQIAMKVLADLSVPLGEGLEPNTDATWIVNADNKIVAFVGNGPRQTDNADAIIEAAARLTLAGTRESAR